MDILDLYDLMSSEEKDVFYSYLEDLMGTTLSESLREEIGILLELMVK